MSFYEDLSTGYLTDLNKEKEDITDHCTDIPTMQTFDVTKANVDISQASAAAKLGSGSAPAPLDSDNPCYAAVEAINGIKMQAESTHSKRAQCLEYYCETVGHAPFRLFFFPFPNLSRAGICYFHSTIYSFHFSHLILARTEGFPRVLRCLNGRDSLLSLDTNLKQKNCFVREIPSTRFTTIICPRREQTLKRHGTTTTHSMSSSTRLTSSTPATKRRTKNITTKSWKTWTSSKKLASWPKVQ